MKKTVVISLIFLFLFNISGMFVSTAADVIKDYSYIINSDPNNASVTFGREVKEINCSFMDGIKLGIKDSDDPLYNEHKEVAGLDCRYFLNKNYPYIKINEDFYEKDDRHFLVSIAFYDFGPSRGTFHFEYFDQTNTKKRITMVKTGEIQDWFVKTLYITDMDLSKTFENGANVRLVNGAFNAFKKVEIVNLSKAYRNKTATNISALTSSKMLNLQQLGIINKEAVEYSESNLYKPCTKESVSKLFKEISGTDYKITSDKITCESLIKACMSILGLKSKGEDLCQEALEIKLNQESDLFISDDAEATNYHLLSIAYNMMYYSENKVSFASQKIADGVFEKIDTTTIDDSNFISAYYAVPRKCPYKIITDNETGMTMKYMNIFGFETVRPYVSQQSWTSDGKSFVVALTSGQMFLYNTETQMLQYIDDVVTDDIVVNGSISLDDKLYYGKKNGSNGELWCYDIKTKTKKLILDGGTDSSFYFPHISNDGKYVSIEYTYPEIRYKSPREYSIARLNVETMELDIKTHKFDYSNSLDHVQVNPVYTDLMFFAHEYDGVITQNEMWDRVWTYDYSTDEIKNAFKQGQFETDGTCIQHATHEVWSRNGEYLYLVVPYYEGRLGKQPSVARIDKDGTHRQYYYTDKYNYEISHTSPTADDRYVVADGQYVTIISTETQQFFPIYRVVINRSNLHPNQPHPIVAPNHYKVNWGMVHEGQLGVAWLDFSDIDKRLAKGGRYSAGETVTRVSYATLDCESKEVTAFGKKASYAQKGNSLFFDINKDIVDSADAAVKISFDYYDNGSQPIVLTYTTGIKNDNDYWKYDNAEKLIKRTGSNKWKHAEIVIDSGNFESYGKYYTDFKISGRASSVYISNIEVSAVK